MTKASRAVILLILALSPSLRVSAEGGGAEALRGHGPADGLGHLGGTGTLRNSVGADRRLEVSVTPGLVITGNNFFRGANSLGRPINRSLSAHLKYAFHFPCGSWQGREYPHTYQGIGMGWHTLFDPQEIGTPLSLYVFQSSRIARLGPRLTLSYEWDFGVSFPWKKYDRLTNSRNIAVGSRVNAYINASLGLGYDLGRGWEGKIGLGASHFSNGNTAYPNAGVNIIGATAGLTRICHSSRRPAIASSLRTESRPKKGGFMVDVMMFGAWRFRGIEEVGLALPGSFAVAGFSLSPMYDLCRNFRVGVSVDGEWDESANIRYHITEVTGAGEVRYGHVPFREQAMIGLSMRGEFVMPIFSIDVGIGKALIYHDFGSPSDSGGSTPKGGDLAGWYQTLTLKTALWRGLYLNVGYQLRDFHVPRHLMLGLGWRIGRRGKGA